ncbi:carbonic anhydrase 2-like [Mizuhopecten yessoensis]|uniref:carbonic anhydrase 2-like n=1 Tax=Mizuhopecten yessoensis TaxID=6573 RepID=UPI000B45A66D|nr:carbonic anhydrase 2-like [Mizuhopecten yessoensis]
MEGRTLFVLVTVVYLVEANHDFNYDDQGDLDPSHWKYVPGWSKCGGKRQSPIDINTEHFTSNDENNNVFLLKSEHSTIDGYFENNGHAPTFQSNLNSSGTLQLESQGKAYDFRNLHFHFGVEPSNGSEHSVDGKYYPAEAHLVHTRKEEGGMSIVVIGVFLSLQEEESAEPPNAEVKRIVEDYIGNIATLHAEIKAEIKPYAVLPNEQDCYTYTGSLTTPPCTEGVHWIIIQKPIVISRKDLDILRSLHGESDLMSDDGIRRPTQRKDVPDVSVGELEH